MVSPVEADILSPADQTSSLIKNLNAIMPSTAWFVVHTHTSLPTLSIKIPDSQLRPAPSPRIYKLLPCPTSYLATMIVTGVPDLALVGLPDLAGAADFVAGFAAGFVGAFVVCVVDFSAALAVNAAGGVGFSAVLVAGAAGEAGFSTVLAAGAASEAGFSTVLAAGELGAEAGFSFVFVALATGSGTADAEGVGTVAVLVSAGLAAISAVGLGVAADLADSAASGSANDSATDLTALVVGLASCLAGGVLGSFFLGIINPHKLLGR